MSYRISTAETDIRLVYEAEYSFLELYLHHIADMTVFSIHFLF